MDNLLEQNKVIAKGVALLYEKETNFPVPAQNLAVPRSVPQGFTPQSPVGNFPRRIPPQTNLKVKEMGTP
jgi:hypothetical protein